MNIVKLSISAVHNGLMGEIKPDFGMRPNVVAELLIDYTQPPEKLKAAMQELMYTVMTMDFKAWAENDPEKTLLHKWQDK